MTSPLEPLYKSRFNVVIDDEEIQGVTKVKFKGNKIIITMAVIDTDSFNTIKFLFSELAEDTNLEIEFDNSEGDVVNTIEGVIKSYKVKLSKLNVKKHKILKAKLILKTDIA